MRITRLLLVLVGIPIVLVAVAGPATACGGLVGENGTIQLVRTTTLAAWHDGIEHYVTSFEFTGEGEEVGSITPLPGIPTSVERGGDWTLQRLAREIAPVEQARVVNDGALSYAGAAEVILETKIDALEITVLRGGGDEVGVWAKDHGFILTPDAPEVLDFYAERSPIFMAARFDATTAKELGQTAGDGTPIHVTIPTDRPWVPLRILGLGLTADQVVEADVFVLTDQKPQFLAGGPGLTVVRDEAASVSLLDDLRSDKGMEWVPSSMWFSYLQVNAAAGELDYDLAASVTPGTPPTLADAGVSVAQVRPVGTSGEGTSPWLPIVIVGTALTGGVLLMAGRRGHATHLAS